MARKKKSIKSKAKDYAIYAAAGSILFGQPFNKVSKVRMFFDAMDFLGDNDDE